MAKTKLTTREKQVVRSLVNAYKVERESVDAFRNQIVALVGASDLRPYVHSVKSRLKDPSHLREKLGRKWLDAKTEGKPFGITRANLFLRVNDLAGVRILHLYTAQFERMHPILERLVKNAGLRFHERAFARTWDDEYRAFFRKCGVKTTASPSLYTSVHYVIRSHSRDERTCELQVRTLFEEVWGEVEHSLNYPKESPDFACREQLRVLARVTSSGTRLVDAVHATWEHSRARARRRRSRM